MQTFADKKKKFAVDSWKYRMPVQVVSYLSQGVSAEIGSNVFLRRTRRAATRITDCNRAFSNIVDKQNEKYRTKYTALGDTAYDTKNWWTDTDCFETQDSI